VIYRRKEENGERSTQLTLSCGKARMVARSKQILVAQSLERRRSMWYPTCEQHAKVYDGMRNAEAHCPKRTCITWIRGRDMLAACATERLRIEALRPENG